MKGKRITKLIRPARDVLLVGKTNPENERVVKPSWSNPVNASNKIGFVFPVQQGGFSWCAHLPGNERVCANQASGSADIEEECISAIRKAREERIDFLNKLKDPLEALKYELENYDVFYAYSDDHSFYPV